MKQNEEEYTGRPSTKPSERIPGRLLRYAGTDYCEFQPQCKKDTATRTMLSETRAVKFYQNVGEKDKSYSLHVNVNGNEEDPAGAIMEQVEKALKPVMKKEPKLGTGVKYLMDTPELKVWQRKKDKKLCCHIEIDISPTTVLMSGVLMRQMQEINKIISMKKY